MYSKRAEYALFRLKTNFYERGEKAGELLVRQLKQKEASYVATAIKTDKGDLVTSNGDINKVLVDFYGKLYKSEVKLEPDKLEAFYSLSPLNCQWTRKKIWTVP